MTADDWQETLETLYLRYGDFYVHRLGTDYALWDEWKLYSELRPDDQPNQRQILENEIVFDMDYERGDRCTNIRNNLSLAQYIRRQLDRENIEYSEWRSGGKGVHIHVFMQPADAQVLKAENALRRFKKWFIREIGGPLYDLGVLDVGTTGQRTLIQLEHVEHRKQTGVKLKRRGTHLEETSLLSWVNDYLNQPITVDTTEHTTAASSSTGSWSETDNELIEYCLENAVTDCRNRLLFFAANRVLRTDDADTVRAVLAQMNQQFAANDAEQYVSDRQLEHFVSRAQQSVDADRPAPSYEWICEQIQDCNDEDLREFAADWIRKFRGDSD